MPRAVYSLRIFSSASLTNSAGTVGPLVPDNLIYVVRDIDVQRGSSGSTDELVIFSQTLGVLKNIVPGMLDAGGNWTWQGRQVYGPGEQVGVHAFVGTWAVAISGYQLTLP